MKEQFRIFAATKKALKPLFSAKEFNETFKISFFANTEDFLKKLEESLPTVIVLEESFILENPDFVKKVQDKTTFLNAINDKITLRVPVVALLKNDNFALQKKFYDLGVSDCFSQNMPSENFFITLHHIAQYITEEKSLLAISHKQQKNTIKQLVHLDKKTGIYNKQTFINKTEKLIQENPTTSYFLILMNLDRFKVFNDLFGFSAGDKILEKIGDHLNKAISSESTYGHIYADHFVVCRPALSTEQFFLRLAKFESFIKTLHPKFDFVCRYGIYKLTNPNEDISLALDRAELALTSIKQNFTERVAFYNETMLSTLKDEQELITDMVTGLERNEFTVFLQPQYDYTTESLIGAEALVRWQHPVKGLISPAVFVPVFERNGFITQLDLFIWEKTCQLLQKWKNLGMNPVPVSVNISRRDIYNQDLVKIFNNLLKKYDLTPELLRLEITESAYMENPKQLIKVVEDLRSHGFCLEMDDFGSGYSSLNTLKEVPVNVLKLDMKFIASDTEDLKDGKNNTKGGNILSSVIRMANWLHLPVIAEGIETKEQADYLKSIGCFYMQGFYFAKPLPIEKYETLLTNISSDNFKKDSQNDELEVAKFLDASKQATVLFDNFIGGTAIIEWSGENIEALRLNDQFFKEIGATRHDFKGMQKNLLEKVEKNSRKVFLATLQEVTSSKASAHCEIKLNPLYEYSEPFWVRVHLKHLGSTITSNVYYMTIENIDFRMRLLKLKMDSAEKLTEIMENIPYGIASISFGEKVELSYSNKFLKEVLGYTKDEFTKISKNPFDILLKNDQEQIQEMMLNTKEDKTFYKETSIYCKNNMQKKVKLSGTITVHSDGTNILNIVISPLEA